MSVLRKRKKAIDPTKPMSKGRLDKLLKQTPKQAEEAAARKIIDRIGGPPRRRIF